MIRKETVWTYLDGRQPVEYWDKEDFGGRVTRVFTGGPGDWKLDSEHPIPDERIICDYCDAPLTEFPVLVFHGHALCPDCRKKYIKEEA